MSSYVSFQQSVTIECIWLKYEIKHLPGGVYDTSGLGDIFGFEVTRWNTLGAERENSDHEFCQHLLVMLNTYDLTKCKPDNKNIGKW